MQASMACGRGAIYCALHVISWRIVSGRAITVQWRTGLRRLQRMKYNTTMSYQGRHFDFCAQALHNRLSTALMSQMTRVMSGLALFSVACESAVTYSLSTLSSSLVRVMKVYRFESNVTLRLLKFAYGERIYETQRTKVPEYWKPGQGNRLAGRLYSGNGFLFGYRPSARTR